ncbi:MAG TPA: S-methyl-5'-thioadenosine phosphorylase [Polyangiales bacterium]|nr:S-methyl-5'-thioadenosine phosphorylase [Polyangiales bacterium]
MHTTLGIIGGSGLYDLPGLTEIEEIGLSTPFGAPSDVIVRGRLGETVLLFLPRHGRGHRIPPHQINYRANVFALKVLGAQQVLSVSAVGSLKEEIQPGDMVVVDQFIDRTRTRPSTFFEDHGIVAHVSLADPTDAALSSAVQTAVTEVGARVHMGGTYVCMEGPQFSSRAESNLYRGWGADVIGMTNLPEAKLMREAELPYASLAMATDYDCWHASAAAVSVEAVIAVLTHNVDVARKTVAALVGRLPDPSQSPAVDALKNAIITAPGHVTKATRELLAPLIGKYLPAE